MTRVTVIFCLSRCRCVRVKNVTAATPTPASISIGEESGTWDLSFENRTEVSDLPEFCNESANPENLLVVAAEKIEKLTKYLHENSDSEKCSKKWKNFLDHEISSMASEIEPSFVGWVNLQDPKMCKADECPKCLWQCGPIFVNGDFYQIEVCCGEYSFE